MMIGTEKSSGSQSESEALDSSSPSSDEAVVSESSGVPESSGSSLPSDQEDESSGSSVGSDEGGESSGSSLSEPSVDSSGSSGGPSYIFTSYLLLNHDGDWVPYGLQRVRRQFEGWVQNVGDIAGGLGVYQYGIEDTQYDIITVGSYHTSEGFDIEWLASEEHVEDSIRIVSILNNGDTTIHVNSVPVAPGALYDLVDHVFKLAPWTAESQTVVVTV